MIDCSMTRLLCMRLGTGPSGTTLEPAYCETGRPYLRRTSGLGRQIIDRDGEAFGARWVYRDIYAFYWPRDVPPAIAEWIDFAGRRGCAWVIRRALSAQ